MDLQDCMASWVLHELEKFHFILGKVFTFILLQAGTKLFSNLDIVFEFGIKIFRSVQYLISPPPTNTFTCCDRVGLWFKLFPSASSFQGICYRIFAPDRTPEPWESGSKPGQQLFIQRSPQGNFPMNILLTIP
jgi:hypothetical protein